MRPGRRSRVGIAVIFASAIVFATAVQIGLPGGRAATGCWRPPASRGITGPATGPTGLTMAGDFGKPLPMAAARSYFGVAFPLPDTSRVRPADVGLVWEESWYRARAVKVTFPSKGLMIYYRRPWPHRHPAKVYQREAAQTAGARVVELNGKTPALAIAAQNADHRCGYFGSIGFVVNDTEVVVMGHTTEANLEAIAQSILARWPV